jgi:penicillin-binding protein 1C
LVSFTVALTLGRICADLFDLARGTHAGRGSADEITLLLTIPQDPTDRLPSVAHADGLRRARDVVARRLEEARALPDGATAALIAASTVPDHLTPFPRQIPHTAARLTEPGESVVSSLDAATQRTLERVLARHRSAREAEDIHNAAVLLVDLPSMAVRAAVGGFDYGDARHAGNIDALDVPRSPGSALKPLIYALAIDAGEALPEQLVPDVPRRYGTWIVDNYDGTYNGVVRLESALSRSLNVPFVDLLARLGVDTMTSALGSCGAASLDRTPGHYGLSAAVGGIEVAPVELSGQRNMRISIKHVLFSFQYRLGFKPYCSVEFECLARRKFSFRYSGTRSSNPSATR